MNIQTSLNNVTTFAELLPIAQAARAKLSFWGAHYVTVAGYEGCLPLDALVKRVMWLLMQRPPWTPETRAVGNLVGDQISRIYHEADRNEKTCNCITYIFFAMRNILHALLGSIRSRTEGYWQDNNGLRCAFDCERFSYSGPRDFQRDGQNLEADAWGHLARFRLVNN